LHPAAAEDQPGYDRAVSEDRVCPGQFSSARSGTDSSESQTANGCPVLRTAVTISREAYLRAVNPESLKCAFSRARPGHLRFSMDKDLHGCQSSTRNGPKHRTDTKLHEITNLFLGRARLDCCTDSSYRIGSVLFQLKCCHWIDASGLSSRNPIDFIELQIMNGMMDEQFLLGLADKVHRGQEGRVLTGFVAGGRCYGYKNVPVEDFHALVNNSPALEHLSHLANQRFTKEKEDSAKDVP
jgi:hypothetical protein